MNKIISYTGFQPTPIVHSIEKKGERSWWVMRISMARDGSLLPNKRVVLFCHSFAEATDWVNSL